jgi:hypothetical protein
MLTGLPGGEGLFDGHLAGQLAGVMGGAEQRGVIDPPGQDAVMGGADQGQEVDPGGRWGGAGLFGASPGVGVPAARAGPLAGCITTSISRSTTSTSPHPQGAAGDRRGAGARRR